MSSRRRSISRVRSALAQATHAFFEQQGFIYLQSPIITASDCEVHGVSTRAGSQEAPRRLQVRLAPGAWLQVHLAGQGDLPACRLGLACLLAALPLASSPGVGGTAESLSAEA